MPIRKLKTLTIQGHTPNRKTFDYFLQWWRWGPATTKLPIHGHQVHLRVNDGREKQETEWSLPAIKVIIAMNKEVPGLLATDDAALLLAFGGR